MSGCQRKPRSAYALPVRFPGAFEPFHVAAQVELAARPLVSPGVCLNPICSRPFVAVRPHQRYCCTECRLADDAEMRAVGLRAAPALLSWQMGRYETTGSMADLSRAGRRFYSSLSAEWWRDRKRRILIAGGQI